MRALRSEHCDPEPRPHFRNTNAHSARVQGRAVLALVCALSAGPAVSAARAAPQPGPTALPLAAAIAEALRVAPQVTQAAHLRAAGNYGVRASRAALLPHLSLTAGRFWTETRDGRPLYAAANGPRETIGLVQVSLPVYAPQVRALARLARDQAALASSQQAQARLLVAAQVTNAWYRLVLMRARQRIWASTLRSVDLLYRGVRQKYAVGAAAVLDLAQTRLLRHNAESGLQQATAQRRAARRVLNLLLARAPASPVTLPVLRPSDRLLPAEGHWVAVARHAQPLLRVAARRIAVGHAQAGIQRAARLPTITAHVGYGVDAPDTPNRRALGWQIFLGVRMPLFNFGEQSDRIADADERVAALRAARRALLLQIRTTIARDYGSASAAERAYVQAVKQRHDARSVYRMTREGFHTGTLNALELAQAENGWLQARLHVATTLVLLRMARTQLRLDAGRYPGEQSTP